MDNNLEQFKGNILNDQENTFGISNTTLFDEDEDPIFGNSNVTANPKDIKPIEQEDKKPEAKPVPKKEEAKVEDKPDDHIDILDDEPKEEVLNETKTTTKDKVNQSEDDNVFEAISEQLQELGIFTPEEGEEKIITKTPEEFKDRFVKEIQKQANGYLNEILSPFGEEGYEMFKSIFVDGVHPRDYLSAFNEIESIKDLDITDESNQESIVRDYYERLGWKKEGINKKIQTLKDTANLEEEAGVVYEQLLAQEEANLKDLTVKAEARKKEQLKYKQEYYNNINSLLQEKIKIKEFDGIPVTDKIAKETLDYLYTEKYKTNSGELLTEFDKDILELRRPENHATKVKLALLLRNKLDLSKVKAKEQVQSKDELFTKLARKNNLEKKQNPSYTNESFI